MKNMLTASLLGLSIAAALSGCGHERVKGTGPAKQSVRNVAHFSGVNVSGSYAVIGSMGSPEKVVLSTNENILPYIETTVKNDVLVVANKASVELEATVPQNIWFFADKFNAITLNGASKFQFFDMKADNLDITLSGSHRLLLTGTAADMHLIVNGESDIDAKKLQVDNATIEIYGSSSVSINPTKTLKVKINGNGKVVYFSKDPKIEQSVSGTGQVISGFGGLASPTTTKTN